MSLVPGDEARVVLVTAPTPEVAAALARGLVEEGLIACANLVPGLRSIYRWQGEVCDDPEVLLVLKTEAGRLEAVEAAVRERHPYDTPELLALPVSEGSDRYLGWLSASLAGAASGEDGAQEE
ncbi:MAG: divalent-cation tolerance protein CutA [Deltaproteobacteria bacterium]|nr:divalent-cation tolerance protein CutA [Deltaproteobacteria bacterium]